MVKWMELIISLFENEPPWKEYLREDDESEDSKNFRMGYRRLMIAMGKSVHSMSTLENLPTWFAAQYDWAIGDFNEDDEGVEEEGYFALAQGAPFEEYLEHYQHMGYSDRKDVRARLTWLSMQYIKRVITDNVLIGYLKKLRGDEEQEYLKYLRKYGNSEERKNRYQTYNTKITSIIDRLLIRLAVLIEMFTFCTIGYPKEFGVILRVVEPIRSEIIRSGVSDKVYGVPIETMYKIPVSGPYFDQSDRDFLYGNYVSRFARMLGFEKEKNAIESMKALIAKV